METILVILMVLVLVGIGVQIYLFINSKKTTEDPTQKLMLDLLESTRKEIQEHGGKSREELQARLDKMQEMMSKSDFRQTQTMQNQFKESQALLKSVTEELTTVKEGTKQVLDVSKQIKSLEDILKNPKQRGIMGEYYLEQILSNVLGNYKGSYEMQYEISKGNIVDAVIKVSDKVIPIDSKFSLENYNRILNEDDPDKKAEYEKAFKNDLKIRIDETAKYIQPSNGTYDFAFMFIPSEGIYYDLLINSIGAVKVNTRDLIEYASKDKKVLIVSPNTFYAYLQTVLQGFKAFQIEKHAQMIEENVKKLGRHLSSYEENFMKVGNHLGTTVNAYNNASKEFKKIDKDVYKITDGEEGGEIETLELERPI